MSEATQPDFSRNQIIAANSGFAVEYGKKSLSSTIREFTEAFGFALGNCKETVSHEHTCNIGDDNDEFVKFKDAISSEIHAMIDKSYFASQTREIQILRKGTDVITTVRTS